MGVAEFAYIYRSCESDRKYLRVMKLSLHDSEGRFEVLITLSIDNERKER